MIRKISEISCLLFVLENVFQRTFESVNSFTDEIYKVPRSKYNSHGEVRYLIVTVIILFLSDAPCPRCRSRLKPKIDVEGKIKVVKFLVSINARRVHISAYVAFAAYVSAAKVLSF